MNEDTLARRRHLLLELFGMIMDLRKEDGFMSLHRRGGGDSIRSRQEALKPRHRALKGPSWASKFAFRYQTIVCRGSHTVESSDVTDVYVRFTTVLLTNPEANL